MMDEFEVRRRLELGSSAKRVLDDEFVMALLDDMEDALTTAWKEYETTVDARENCYYRVQGIRSLRSNIVSLAKDGDIAAEDLTREFPS